MKQIYYAHRGLYDNASAAPENSLAAFLLAVEAGYGIELDVQLTKDEIPVVFHDESLSRMCNVKGKVWEYTYIELKEFALAGTEERIPTLQDVLNLVNGRVPLIIEYKLDVPSTKVCAISNKILSDYQGLYCIESFHPFALRWYKKNRPDIMRGQLAEAFYKTEKYKGKILFILLSGLIFNFITRPDFIAYNHRDANNVSRIVSSWLGALPVAYTLKNQEELDKVRGDFELFIFDSFIPE